MLGLLGEFRQMLADLEAGHAGGDFAKLPAVGVIGLEVERINLRRSAGHP